MFAIRPLTTLEDCRRVVELEKRIWGYTDAEDVVPVPILMVTVRRGGILLGAFDESGDLAGFVYSLPALKHGRPTQWSHMLGVLPHARNAGVGRRLKLEQRRAALAMGLDLIEWTFDPLQALNAHFNFARLGVVAAEYEVNIYGESSSPLHRGTPTDRLIAEWHLTSPRVVERIGRSEIPGGPPPDLPVVNVLEPGPDWPACGAVDPARAEPRVGVDIPTGFTELQAARPDLALAWRLATREIFTAYLARGYRVVDFHLLRGERRGRYELARE
ncbi:MAG TPA: hypothetical protein VNI83_03450 [Vicinamibacterales bacterium]|nr:hypothetical protein [Vicinamibacterales bacterium]